MEKTGNRPLVLITNIWKLGSTYVIKIPKEQTPLFQKLHGKKLKVSVQVLEGPNEPDYT